MPANSKQFSFSSFILSNKFSTKCYVSTKALESGRDWIGMTRTCVALMGGLNTSDLDVRRLDGNAFDRLDWGQRRLDGRGLNRRHLDGRGFDRPDWGQRRLDGRGKKFIFI